jgi:hypothetical protein
MSRNQQAMLAPKFTNRGHWRFRADKGLGPPAKNGPEKKTRAPRLGFPWRARQSRHSPADRQKQHTEREQQSI